MTDPKAIIQERAKTHGDYALQALVAVHIQNALHDDRLPPITAAHRFALNMIAVKMARIVCGDASHDDHWDDIAGYALLGRDSK